MGEITRRIGEVCKKVSKFCAKVFVFGLACSLVLGACAAAIYYYNNRAVPAKAWPPEADDAFGIVVKLRTEWRDGQAKYELSVTPSSDNKYLPIDRWESSESAKTFEVTLKDSGGFNIEGCSTGEIPLSDFTLTSSGSRDTVSGISHEGNMLYCDRSKYISGVTASATWRLPYGSIEKIVPSSTIQETEQPNGPVKKGMSGKPVQWALAKSGIAELRKRCAFDSDPPYGCILSDEQRVAALQENDCVELLSDKIRMANGDDAYEARFRQWRGWIEVQQITAPMGTKCH
jgi:hypothetical protein